VTVLAKPGITAARTWFALVMKRAGLRCNEQEWDMRFYPVTRDVHLYGGLFISPFVVAFALSVFVLVHPAGSTAPASVAHPARRVENLGIPAEVENLSGRARVDAVRSILEQAHVRGEIGPIRYVPKQRRLSIPVIVPGRETTIDLDLGTRTATIVERETGIWDALILLHKAPGQHLADIRGNWLPMRIWGWAADATVYLVLLTSVSGVYLWMMLRPERRPGMAMLIAGAVSFFGMVYALAG
jgi:hypothetical protein